MKIWLREDDITGGDYDGIRNEIKNLDWELYLKENQNNTDETWDKFEVKIRQLEEKYMPLTKPMKRKNELPLEKEVTDVIKEKNRPNKKFMETKDEQIRKKYNKVRNKAEKLVKRARKNYEKT